NPANNADFRLLRSCWARLEDNDCWDTSTKNFSRHSHSRNASSARGTSKLFPHSTSSTQLINAEERCKPTPHTEHTDVPESRGKAKTKKTNEECSANAVAAVSLR